MLTTAQQKVKRELEELQINAALTHSKDQTIIPRKRSSFKKWSFTIIVTLLLIVTISLFFID
jgi:hypothetical protein